MRALPWRVVVKADRKAVLTALAISFVTSFALAGFSMTTLLQGESIDPTGRFAAPDAIELRDASDRGEGIVVVADVPLADGTLITVASGTVPDLGLPSEGNATLFHERASAELAFASGIRLRGSVEPPRAHFARSWVAVSLSDLEKLRPNATTTYAYALEPMTDASEQTVPAVGAFVERSGREVGADLVLLVVFCAVLVTIFSYEFITSEIRERRQEIAVWRSLGMRARDVLALVMARALTIALAASFGGLVLCVLMLRAVSSLASSLSEVGLPSIATTLGVLGTIAASGTLGAIIPARSASRVQVREAMEGGA